MLFFLLIAGKHGSAQFGGILAFDGTVQSVLAPAGVLNNASIFTVEFMVKTTETGTSGTYWQRPTLLGNATDGNVSGDFGITTNNGYIGMWSGLHSGNDNDFLSATVQINNNAWHHIAAVNDGTNIKLFVDGSLTGSIASGLALVTVAAPLTIGASSLNFGFSGNVGLNNFFHHGEFDEVRISNNVRYTNNFTVPVAAFASDANTIALYHLEGCVSGLIPDASPNANNGRPHNFSGSCAFTLPPTPSIPNTSAAPNILKTEYFYDADPGFGNGTNIPVTAALDITGTYAVNTQLLTNGAHRLYVRSRDAGAHWSVTNTLPIFIVPVVPTLPATSPLNRIMKAEYFYDADPGFGNGTDIPVTATYDLAGSFAVNTQALGSGVHRIYLRTRDSARNWSISNIATFFKLYAGVSIAPNKTGSNIIKAEYFLDTDPGFGNGINIPITPGTDITLSNVFVNIAGLTNGVHRVYVRTKDTDGSWTATNNNVFSIVAASFPMPPNPVPGTIVKLEYFFDTDPGFGQGHVVSVAASTDLPAFTFAADVSALNDSIHTLYVRTYGGWSITNTRSFLKGAILPLNWLTFNAKMVATSVLLNWQTTNEKNTHHFEIERSSDANAFSKIGMVNAVTSPATVNNYQLTDANPAPGLSYYRIKQVDADGKYQYSAVIAIRFANPRAGGMSIYPNPATNIVNMLFDQPQANDAIAEFINVKGQVVKSVSLGGSQFKTVSIAELTNGVYAVRIKSNGVISNTGKAVIKR